MIQRSASFLNEWDQGIGKFKEAFRNIVLAKVSSSAYEAIDFHYIRATDGITLNIDRLISDAKSAAIQLAERNYQIPDSECKCKVIGITGHNIFRREIDRMRSAGLITDHDSKIAWKLAWIICGGNVPSYSEVTQEYLLDLEREAFLSLCGERKTLERIKSILDGRKTIRN